MRNGVTIVDTRTPGLTLPSPLENDVTLLPGVQLHDSTTVATGAIGGHH